MARLAKIPETLHKEILAKSALGKSSSEIADWLGQEHNISITRANVSKLLAKRKEERTEITKSLYAEAVSDTATKDLRIVDGMIDSLAEEYYKHLKDAPTVSNGFAKTLSLYLNYRSNLLGNDSPADKITSNEQLIAGLLGKLGR